MTATARLRPLVLALALALPLAGCGDNNPEGRVEAARKAIQKSDYKTAVIELKSALQTSPDNTEARLLLGQAFQTTGDWQSSEKELRKALEMGGHPEQVLPLLAKTLVKQGKYKDATELVIPTAGLASLSLVAIQVEKANAYLALNKPAQASSAISAAEKVLEAAGGGAFSNDLQLTKSRLALVNKQTDQAFALINTILQRDANFIDALYFKAQLLQANGKGGESLKIYEQIVASKPDEIGARLSIADAKLIGGDIPAAELALQASEKIDANLPSVKLMRAKVYLTKGELKKANEALQQVLRVAPDHLPSLMIDAAVNYGLGNNEQSIKSANKVLAQIPNQLFLTKILAANELSMGNAKVALSKLLPLAETHKDDFELISLLGETYLQLNNPDKAMLYLEQAESIQPKNSAIRQSKAVSHLSQGRPELAELELEQAGILSERVGQADYALIALQLGRKEFDKALLAISRLEKKQPNNHLTHNLRGVALLGKNDSLGARQSFEKSLAIKPDYFPAASNLVRIDLAENKPETARKRYEAILKHDGKNVSAMMALARLSAANKRENDALNWFEKASAAAPNAVEPRVALARHYLTNKNPQKALAIANEAVRLGGANNAEALALQGAAQIAAGDNNSGLATFLRLTEMNPNSAEAFYRLGTAQVAARKQLDGRATFEKALKLHSGHVEALDALLLLDVADKKWEKALQRTRNFQMQNPKSAVGFAREADILFRNKQYVQAAKAYEQSLDRDNDLKVFSKMQSSLLRAGNQKLADKNISDLLKKYPQDLSVKTFSAEYAAYMKRDAEAVLLYEDLIKKSPKNPLLLNNLALVYQRLKDPRALQTAEQALKLAPQHPEMLDTVGWLLVEQGQPKRGLALLQQAAEKAPGSGTIRYHLAVAMANSSNVAAARQELEILLKSAARFPESNAAKALLSSLQGSDSSLPELRLPSD